MRTKIIGNKKIFAIDYYIEIDRNDLLGSCRIWVEKKYIGSMDDKVNISILYDALNRVKEFNYNNEGIVDFKNSEMLFDLLSNNEIGDFALLGFPENFDDFEIRVFKSSGFVYFLWKLGSEPFFTYPNLLTDQLYNAKIDLDCYLTTLHEFKTKLDEV